MQADVLLHLGFVLKDRGQLEEARAVLEEAAELYRTKGVMPGGRKGEGAPCGAPSVSRARPVASACVAGVSAQAVDLQVEDAALVSELLARLRELTGRLRGIR